MSEIMFMNLFLSFIILKILSNLVSLTSLYSLPILANLTREFKSVEKRSRSNGKIDIMSIKNQLDMYFLAITFLSSTSVKFSSKYAVLKIIQMSQKNKKSIK